MSDVCLSICLTYHMCFDQIAICDTMQCVQHRYEVIFIKKKVYMKQTAETKTENNNANTSSRSIEASKPKSFSDMYKNTQRCRLTYWNMVWGKPHITHKFIILVRSVYFLIGPCSYLLCPSGSLLSSSSSLLSALCIDSIRRSIWARTYTFKVYCHVAC